MPLAVSSKAKAQSIVDIEISRRKLGVVEADKALMKGRKAYAEKNYQEAVDQYRKAVQMLPPGHNVADRRREYVAHLVDGSVALAQQYRRHGKLNEARDLLTEVLVQDPGNVLATKQLEYLDDPIRTSPTLTEQHVRNVDKVRRLLYRAQSYYDQAQFDLAVKEYEEVLLIDPYNKAARRGMERVAQEKLEYYKTAYDQNRADMLMEVTQQWERHVVATVQDVPTGIGGELDGDLNPALYNKRKLQNIMLESVDFDEDTTVKQAINYLRQRSRELDQELDPRKRGLNFVIRDTRTAPEGLSLEGEEGEGLGEQGKIEDIKFGELKLNNVPMDEVLKQITRNAQLRFKAEDFGIVIMRANALGDTEMFTRVFRVPPDFMTHIDGNSGSGDGGAPAGPFDPPSATVERRKPLNELLGQQGIPFPQGSTAAFSRAQSTLTIRNTSSNLDLVEQLVERIRDRKPKQIKMLARFVEVSQENTDELGFDWLISPFGVSSVSTFMSGGTVGNGATKLAQDFVSPISGVSIPGVPSQANQNVSNIATGGLRSGDFAITRDSIDAFLNNPQRTGSTSSVAPGILSLTGLFTDGQVQMIMRGLNQKKGADVMTAPSIVSRSGETARIEIIREFIYPTEYEPPELPNQVGIGGGFGNDNNAGNTGGSIFPVTPATPTAFETRNTGVTLEVEPTLGEDGYTIDLRFAPEIVEFEGFINYGSPIQSPASDALGNPITVTITENRIEMPVFSTRRVSTALTIYDGHTVAVGGLMREEVQNVEDKVPVLGDIPLIGRLFQSKAENHIKSNLIIFVSVSIIDATGQRVVERVVKSPTGSTSMPVGGDNGGLLPTL